MDPNVVERGGTGKASDDRILARKGYEVKKKLGEGAYAKVYLSTYTDAKSGATNKLACKVIEGNKAPRDFIAKFFPREVEVMRKVNHPHLIRMHSIVQRKQRFFLFMQFAEKGDMLDFIRANGGVKESQAKLWYSQIVQGMGYMHDLHMCHRDMKCENLLLTASYNIKVSDFGFARVWKPTQAKSQTYCGSVTYCPPEIIRGVPYDPLKADCWSMGIILYVMCNKAMPFDDSSLKKMYDQQVGRGWKLTQRAKKRCSKDLKNMIHLLLEPVPHKRPSCGEMWNHPWIQSNPMNRRGIGKKKKGGGGASTTSSKASTKGKGKGKKKK